MNIVVNGKLLKPLKGTLPLNHKENTITKRPFVPISHEEHDKIKCISVAKLNDFFLYKEKVVTFGHVSEGFMLMPLLEDRAKEILALNRL